MESTLLTTSLKDYKTSIDELRASLLNLNKDSEEYKKTVEEITERQKNYDEALAIGKKNIDGAEGSYNALVRQMKVLKDEWRATNDEARRNELGTAINDINNQLKNFDATIGNHQRNVGDYEIATKSLRQEYAELKQQLARGIVDKKSTEELEAIVKQAGDLKDAMKDAEAMINEAADDVRGFTTALDVANTAMAGFTAAQGLAQLFGDEDGEMKELVETMKQLQAATATLNALQQVQTALVDRGSATYRLYHKAIEVYLRLAVGKTKAVKAENTETEKNITLTKTDTTVQTTDAAAKTTNAVATSTLTKALKALRVAAVSIIGLGVGALLVLLVSNLDKVIDGVKKLVGWLGKVTGVGEVIKNIVGWVSDSVDAFKKWAHITEEKTAADIALENAEKALKKASEEYYETLGKERVELKANIAQLKNFKGSKEDEKKIVDELNSKYGDTLGTYKNINDWQKKLVTDGEKYIQYLYEEAKATAFAQEAARLYADWKINNIKRSSQENLEAKRIADEAERLALEQASKANTLGASLYGGDNAKEAKKTSSKTNTEKVDTELLKNLKADLAKRKEYLDNYYAYEKAKGEDAVADEKNKYEDIYNAEKDYYAKAKALLTDRLADTKLSTKQRAQYEKELADLEKGFANATWKFNIEKEKQRTDEKKKETEKRKKIAEEELNADLHSLDREEKTMLRGIDNKQSEIAVLEQTFSVEKYFIEERIRLYKLLRDSYAENSEEYKKYNNAVIKEQEKLEDKTAEHNEKMTEATAEDAKKRKESLRDFAYAVGDLVNEAANFYQSYIEMRVKQGKMSEKEAEKEFEKVKKIQIAESIISTIAGAVEAYMGTIKMYKGYPIAIPLAIVNAATVTAAGMANVAKIKAQSMNGGGSGGSSSSGGIMSASVSPLIDGQDVAPDYNAITAANTSPDNNDTRVYVVESDISTVSKRVEVRESEATF